MNKSIVYISILITGFTSNLAYCQENHNIHDNIALEAFEGFARDSFTLPGDSIAQPVYKYGIYKSTVTTHLDDVGEVFIHHVLYFQEEEYVVLEVYSMKPSSEFIQGIKRYGNFRMYECMGPAYEVAYHGVPKIEIVRGINSIINTLYPLSLFEINGSNEIKIHFESENDINTVSTVIGNYLRYIDTFLLNENNRENEINYIPPSRIQYGLEDGLIKINLHLGLINSLTPGAFESLIFDSLGNQIARISDYGALNLITLSEDRRYAYSTCGGALTEDYLAPYIFRIHDIGSGKIAFYKRSITNELSGWSIPNSNLGVFEENKSFGGPYSLLSAIVFDHDKHVMYPISSNSLCAPPVYIRYYPTYCECHKENGSKTKHDYVSNFTSLKFN